jgi:hypothetical protein
MLRVNLSGNQMWDMHINRHGKINDVFQNVGYVTLTTIVMMVAMRTGLCVVGVAQFKNLIYQYSGVIFNIHA